MDLSIPTGHFEILFGLWGCGMFHMSLAHDKYICLLKYGYYHVYISGHQNNSGYVRVAKL